jgi:uncharacterized protein YdeI (YjbR/CyaY-like superfamily)
MEVTTTLDPQSRQAWRSWLEQNQAQAREIWILLRSDRISNLTYLDAVEEALCFGWIDGIAKKWGDAVAHRFTPRRARSHWTELNKERARRMIAAGQMTDAGRRVLPDLNELNWQLPEDIRVRLQAVAGAWEAFCAFPPLYQRVRIGYIEEVRKTNPTEWEKRLRHFVLRTAKNEKFGNWDDSLLRRSP